MKNKLFFAVASAALAVACAKNAPVEEPNLPVVPDDGIHRAELISFNTNVYSVATAKAALDSWNSQPIFIYGVNKANGALHIDNDAAIAPAAGETAITLSDTYYYDPSNTCYDFYGYYVDDAILGPVSVAEGNITYPVTISGSQDIMLAKADQATDIEGTEVNIPDYAYSAFSARRGVVPNLEFKHQLSKFTFQIKAGSESGSTVAVTNLTLTSKTTGDLTVVGAQGLVGNGETYPLTLALPVDCTPGWNQESNEASAPKVLGDLMVIPGEPSYDLAVSLGDIVPAIPIKITPEKVGAEKFEAGYAYTITIIIYGIEEIDITATMAPWVNGGEMTFDPDEEWRNNNTPQIP